MNDHELLDQFKLRMAEATLECADLPTIRSKSLLNMQRWKDKGTWGAVYDEWWALMADGSDCDVINAMTGPGDTPNRLRQSGPYIGIVDPEVRELCLAEHRAMRSLNDARARFERSHAEKLYDLTHKEFDVFFDYVVSAEPVPASDNMLFLDIKLTGLGQKRPGLISIALVDKAGDEFYAELPPSHYADRCNEWARVNVLPQLWGAEHIQSVETVRHRLAVWIGSLGHQYGIVTKCPEASLFLLQWLLPTWPENVGHKIHSFSLRNLSVDVRPRIHTLMASYHTPNRPAHHALHDAHALRLGVEGATGRAWPLFNARAGHAIALNRQ